MSSLVDTLTTIVENTKKLDEDKKNEWIENIINKLKAKIDKGEELTKFAAQKCTAIYWKVDIPNEYYKDKRNIIVKIARSLNGYEGLHITYKIKYKKRGEKHDSYYIAASWEKSWFNRIFK